MSEQPTLVWFRQDLRLDDNLALLNAVERGGPVLPVFVWAAQEEGAWAPASASRWWLHQSLLALDRDLRQAGSRLIIREGPTRETLTALGRQVGARAIVWNRRYEPVLVERDRTLKQYLRTRGFIVESFNANLLFEPWQVQTRQGRPYQVYTPFWNACHAAAPPPPPQSAPSRIPPPEVWPRSLDLDDLQLEPMLDWAGGLRALWRPGAAGARERLDQFLDGPGDHYAEDRDRPDREGTSQLSPHLHFGEISPRRIWQRVQAAEPGQMLPRGREVFLKQLVWREFAYHQLYHNPHTTDQPLRSEFAAFPWQDDPAALRAWQRGRTGYPLVDAGMRQLWHTGWMHNRVRMIVASFLVKDLLLPWQLGARWFWDTLVDADLACNSLGWQWTAGCGADAAPYFRVFNPVSQGEKFDPDGDYVRRWIPELARLPTRYIHNPGEAPPLILADAGVGLGRNYPRPIVDHAAARDRALQALASLSRPAT